MSVKAEPSQGSPARHRFPLLVLTQCEAAVHLLMAAPCQASKGFSSLRRNRSFVMIGLPLSVLDQVLCCLGSHISWAGRELRTLQTVAFPFPLASWSKLVGL